jgi:hypothetical protein
VSAAEAYEEYSLRLAPWDELGALDAMILAVPHRELLAQPLELLV